VVLGALNTETTQTEIRTTQATNTARAIAGVVTHTGAGGATAGIWGQSNAQNGSGVFGVALNGFNAKGVWGRSTTGAGVFGEATGTTGINYGVKGTTPSPSGTGVFGLATGSSGFTTGIAGQALSPTGRGVVGFASAQSGSSKGVYGQSNATGGFGVYGYAGSNAGTSYGVYGESSSYQGYGLYGRGRNVAVVGIGGSGAPGGSYGVWASGTKLAGYFNGPVHVAGVLSKSSGTFLIDHPMDPANRTLAHSFVEAPEMLNIYRGTATLDRRGRAVVRLPRYFHALNTEFGYQLTAIGAPSPSLHVASKIDGNRFSIAGGAPGQEVCWIVTGVRHDAFARAHPLRVERAKGRRDRGKYLNPDLYGEPASAGIHYQRSIGARARRRQRSPGA
jgi:hypothetical protein